MTAPAWPALPHTRTLRLAQPKRTPRHQSLLEDWLVAQIHAAGLPAPEREGRLIPGRRYRVDLFWPGSKLVCEVDGGTFVAGRHSRGVGITSDCEKSNLLTLAGWRVLRVTNVHVRDGSALAWIRLALIEGSG